MKATPSVNGIRKMLSLVTQFKEHLYGLIKAFKRKLPVYSDLGSDQGYRMKSSNLRHHADELLASLHALAISLDDVETMLTTASTLLVHSERDHSGKVIREILNV